MKPILLNDKYIKEEGTVILTGVQALVRLPLDQHRADVRAGLNTAVVAHADQSDLYKPKAYVVLKPEYAPSDELEQELIQYCREKMADYKRPRWIEFVDELPKTATGKIQRFKLRN